MLHRTQDGFGYASKHSAQTEIFQRTANELVMKMQISAGWVQSSVARSASGKAQLVSSCTKIPGVLEKDS